ncbi:MAG: type II toxin-antitoxin system RatA family toxin [Alphaproteobacteria bacterium]
MATHAEKRVVPYTPQQMFDLVADVERYPEFLPWCQATRIREKLDNGFTADLVIGWKMLRERYTSRVTLLSQQHIKVEYMEGPLSRLNNEWGFYHHGQDECLIDFYLNFEFRSKTLQSMMELVFNEAVRHMVQAFETRARKMYGSTAIV